MPPLVAIPTTVAVSPPTSVRLSGTVLVADGAVSLTYAEAAVALGASDMPGTRRAANGCDVLALLVQGVERLDFAEIHTRDAAFRRAVGDMIAAKDAGRSVPASFEATTRAVWGSHKRSTVAHDLAYRVTIGRRAPRCVGEDDGTGRSGRGSGPGRARRVDA